MITITIYPCNAKGSGRVVIVLEPSQLYQYMNEPIGQEMHVITIMYMWITQAEATYMYIAGVSDLITWLVCGFDITTGCPLSDNSQISSSNGILPRKRVRKER